MNQCEHLDAMRRHNEATAQRMLEAEFAPPSNHVQVEDRLRGAVIEALHYLRAGAPQRTMQILENVLEL